MKKNEFITNLSIELKKQVSEEEAGKVLFYYRELIDDAIDSGKDETEFIASLPTPEIIAQRIEYELISQKDEGASQDFFAQSFEQAGAEQANGKGAPSFGKKLKQNFSEIGKTISEQTKITTQQIKSGVKNKKVGNTIVKIIALFFFSIIVLPIAFGVIAGLFGGLIGLWAGVISLIAAGIVTMPYSVAAAALGESIMVLFAYGAAGLMLLGLGLLTFKGMTKLSYWFFVAIKKTTIFTVKLFKF